MGMTQATMLADSINEAGDRLTTFHVCVPKYLLGQLAKHRQLSMNFESSRAKPYHKVLQQVIEDPFVPEVFGVYKTGMQPDAYLEGDDDLRAKNAWLNASVSAARSSLLVAHAGAPTAVVSGLLSALRDNVAAVVEGRPDDTDWSLFVMHKPVVAKETANRVLEPFMMVEGIVSATEWDNFLKLRAGHSTGAQSDISDLATQIEFALDHNRPKRLARWEWHKPYPDLTMEENVEAIARVSYGNLNKVSTRPAGELYAELAAQKHLSPFEHVANTRTSRGSGNFRGWNQLREEIEKR